MTHGRAGWNSPAPRRAHLPRMALARPPAAAPPPLPHKGPPRLLFVGKLEDVKGPDLLLSALDLLRRGGGWVGPAIVGGGGVGDPPPRGGGGGGGRPITVPACLPPPSALRLS